MMDLASLQISIKETGATAAISKLEKLESQSKSLEKAIASLNKKLDLGNSISSGISLIGEAAKTATAHVKTLKDTLNSIGVNKLSDVIKGVNQVTDANLKAAKTYQAIQSAIQGVIRDEEKTRQAVQKTNQEREKANILAAKAKSISDQSAQSVINSAAVTQARTNAIGAQSFQNTMKSQAQITAINTNALNQNALGQQRLATETARTNNTKAQSVVIGNNQTASQARAERATTALANSQAHAARMTEEHNKSWLQHIASVAGGIVVYQGIRTALGGIIDLFSNGIRAVDDYQISTIQLASIITTLAKTGDPGENYVKAKQYADALVPSLQQIDAKTTLNLSNLIKITEEMAKQGVLMDASNAKQVEGMTRIANVIALYSRNGQNELQVQQEIRSALQGQHKDNDQMGKLLYSILGDRLKPMLKVWQEQGNTIEKIGDLLVGFGPATKDMEGTWSAVTSSMKTTFDLVARETLTPILKDWVLLLSDVNTKFREHSKIIAEKVQGTWTDLKGVIKTTADNIWLVNGAISVFIAGKVVQGLMAVSSAFQAIQATAVVMGATISEIALPFAALAGAIYLLITRWEKLVNSFKLGQLYFQGKISFNDWKNATPETSGEIIKKAEQPILQQGYVGVDGSRKAYAGQQSILYTATNSQAYSSDPFARAKASDLTYTAPAATASGRPPFDVNAPKGTDHSTQKLKLENERKSLTEKLENITGKVNQFAVAAEKYVDAIDTVRKSTEKGAGNETLRAKAAQAAERSIFDAYTSPFDKITDALDKKESLFDKYSIGIRNISKMLAQAALDAEEQIKLVQKSNRPEADKLKVVRVIRQAELQAAIAGRKAMSATENDYIRNAELKLGMAGSIKREAADSLDELEKMYQKMGKYDQFYYDKKDSIIRESNRKLLALDNTTLGIIKQSLVQWSDSWSNTLNDMVWGAKTSFSEILQSFGKMITQMIIQKQIVEPIVGSITGMFTGGSSMPAISDNGGAVPVDLRAYLQANGGIMTSMGPAMLRRYATGGVANSPQVAIYGEGSMNEAFVPLPDGRSIPVTMNSNSQDPTINQNIKVEIVNQSNEELKATTTSTRQDASGMVLSIVIDGIQRNKMGLRDILTR